MILLLASLVSSPGFAETRLPRPRVESVPAGPQIAWFESSKLPLVDFVMAFPAGSRFDPAGKSGTASLLATVMEHDPVHARAEALGATLSVDASEERLLVSAHGLSEDAPKLLRWMIQLARAPKLETAVFEREKKRMLERWERIGDGVPLLANFLFVRLLTAGTPYGRGNALSPKELGSVRLADLRSFHASRVVADGSLLLAVGDVRADAFRATVAESVAGWGGRRPRRRDVEKYWSVVSPFRPEKGVTWVVDRPGAAQTEIRMGFPAPPYLSPDRDALAVANALIGETFTSRLLSRVRDEKGLAYSIGSGFTHALHSSSFWIQTATHTLTTAAAMEEIAKVWEGLRTHPPSEEEVASAKEFLVGSFPVSTRTLVAVASRWMTLREYGLSEDSLDTHADRIRAVTAEQVRAVIGRHLLGRDWTKVLAGDAKSIAPSLRLAGERIKTGSVSDLRSFRASPSDSPKSAPPRSRQPRSSAKGP